MLCCFSDLMSHAESSGARGEAFRLDCKSFYGEGGVRLVEVRPVDQNRGGDVRLVDQKAEELLGKAAEGWCEGNNINGTLCGDSLTKSCLTSSVAKASCRTGSAPFRRWDGN